MLVNFIVAIVMVIIVFNIWSNWNDTKINWKSLRTWIICLITSSLTVFNYFNISTVIKLVVVVLIFILSYKTLFRKNLNELIAIPVLSEILILVSEMLFACLVISFLKNGEQEFVNNYFGAVITNTSISVLALLISKIKVFKKISNKINLIFMQMDELNVIFFSCLIIFVFTIFYMNSYFHLNSNLLMVLSSIVLIISFIFVFVYFKIKDDYNKISEKYNSSLNSLKELENVITESRIDNHENKNHLMTIRNMTSSKKITKFIDSILNNKIKDNKKIMKETSSIPSGGLRGLIYSKLLIMANKNIDYELDIASSVRVVDMLDYGDDTILDICKIIGIFLDNAIEEVDTIDDKYIIIEMYKEKDTFIVSITNTYNNSFDKKDIYNPGYSTKEGNHGYGLTLVKKIVRHNKKIKTHHEISDNEFTQVLELYK